MSGSPSDFLAYLKKNSTVKEGGKAEVTVRLPPEELDRLLAEAQRAESPPVPAHTNGHFKVAFEDESALTQALRQILAESKLATANLKDRRAALQIIAEIAKKALPEK